MSKEKTPRVVAEVWDNGDEVWQARRDAVLNDNTVEITSDTDEPLDEREESELRDELDEFVIACSSTSSNRLHIPDDEGNPVCAQRTTLHKNVESNDWSLKPTNVYPQGFKDLCIYCSNHWRETHE